MNPIGTQHIVNILGAASTQSTQALPLNLPCQDLLDDGRREEYLKICVPLYKASMGGDWKAAKDILKNNKELVRFSINGNNETALHVAVSRGHKTYVKNLVSLMEEKDLELQDNNSYTAFCLAVANGDVKMAEILLEENKALIDISTDQGMMALQMALSFRRQDMLKFLYKKILSMPGDLWTLERRMFFLLECTKADFFDIALRVVMDQPKLAVYEGSLLRILAQKPKAFELKLYGKYIPTLGKLHGSTCSAYILLKIILKNIEKFPWTMIQDMMSGSAKTNEILTDSRRKNSSSVLFLAAEAGNAVFIREVITQYPQLLQERNDINQSIFHVAVSHRHTDIFGLISEIGSSKYSIIASEDFHGNNMLHLVGICSNSENGTVFPGAACELRQELIWFKEVESMLPLSFREKKNASGCTPREEFTNHHKHLVTEGEKWLKETGAQLMVVAALLATISFAATITFAGGYNQDTGYPIFHKKRVFQVFLECNFSAFLFASTSIIIVISLLTSRFSEIDFLKSLPYKLALSVVALLTSIFLMVFAFAANYLLVFEQESTKVLRYVTLFVSTISLLAVSFTELTSLLHYLSNGIFGWRTSLYHEQGLLPPVDPASIPVIDQETG